MQNPAELKRFRKAPPPKPRAPRERKKAQATGAISKDAMLIVLVSGQYYVCRSVHAQVDDEVEVHYYNGNMNKAHEDI